MKKAKGPRTKTVRGPRPVRRKVSKAARLLAYGDFPTKKEFPNPPYREVKLNIYGTREDIAYFVEVGKTLDLITDREWSELRRKCLGLFKRLKREDRVMIGCSAETLVASQGSFVDGGEVFGSDPEDDWPDTGGWMKHYFAGTPVTVSYDKFAYYFYERIRDRCKAIEPPKTAMLMGLRMYGFRFTGKSPIVLRAKKT